MLMDVKDLNSCLDLYKCVIWHKTSGTSPSLSRENGELF